MSLDTTAVTFVPCPWAQALSDVEGPQTANLILRRVRGRQVSSRVTGVEELEPHRFLER